MPHAAGLATKHISIFGINIPLASLIWFLMGIAASIIQVTKGLGSINNYLIFEGVFRHTIQQSNLYLEYPGEYLDSNHYGPTFAAVIAPFAIFPPKIGCLLWCFANFFLLWLAIKKLPLTAGQQNFILLFSAIEMMTATHNVQSNAMVAAWLILALVFVQKGKEFWACFFIVLATLVKVYGIAALAFFFFSENKPKFVLYTLFWSAVLFCLPMIFSSPQFVTQSYVDWYHSLSEKNSLNTDSVMQNVSAMRVVNKLLHLSIPNLYFLAAGGILMLLPLAWYKKWKETHFRLLYLVALLICVVIFSSSAESSTYIIAIPGVALWYVLQDKKTKWAMALVIFAWIFTSLSATDLFPKFVKQEFIRPYAIKALPCLVVWVVAVIQLLKNQENKIQRL